MFRALFLIVLAMVAVVSIDPIWNARERQLTLRVRAPAEIFVVARERARQLGDLMRSSDDEKKSAVSEPSRTKSEGSESLTPDERRALQKLVQETARGN